MVSDLFRTTQPVIIYPSSGTGAAEAALVNTLSPGDVVLVFNSGFFAERWSDIATRYGLRVRVAGGDWEHAVRVEDLTAALRQDPAHHVKAVLVVHSETSTGLTAPIAGLREALDETGHPALLLVDAISSLGTMIYEHDSWGADVTVASSQKGLMLPPGLGFNAVSARALAASAGSAGLPRSYWAWSPILEANRNGYYPYTPPISLLAGLHESVMMIAEETLPGVQARHAALADLARKTIRSWGLDIVGAGEPHSNSLTAFWLPPGFDAAEVHMFLTERYGISLGKGLGQFAGRVLRVGHLGDMDVPTLTAALAALHSGLTEIGALPAPATATSAAATPGIATSAVATPTPGTAAPTATPTPGADGAGTLPSPLGAPGEQAR